MGLIKIHKGTRTDLVRLCDSCRYATIVKGAAESQELVFCSMVFNSDHPVPMRVVDCSKYSDRTTPSLRSMEDLAWVLVTDKSGKKIGFMSKDQWKKEKKYESKIPEGEWDD